MAETILRRFEAADTAWLVQQHRDHYAQAEGFDGSFGKLVAEILSDFNSVHDSTCERGWVAEQDGHRLGSIFCVRQGPDVAKLRLFYLTEDARGQGLGKRLLSACMDYARDAGYAQMQLWTHESHRAACALYAAFGWELTGSKPVRSFGQNLIEQSWRVTL